MGLSTEVLVLIGFLLIVAVIGGLLKEVESLLMYRKESKYLR